MSLKISKLPSDLHNVYKAYINVTSNYSKHLNALDLNWENNQPKTLKTLVLDLIIKLWSKCPEHFILKEKEDKNYLLEKLDINIPIKILSQHIQDDLLWKRCFRSQWPSFYPNVDDRRWISIFMEKYLAENLENLDPCDYDQEEIQKILDICSVYVIHLDINYLQPSMGQGADHIPFDFLLSNLPELRKFKITFDSKTIGTNYYLGCCSPSKNDMIYFCRGLQKCYDLTEFNLHSTKMDPLMLRILGKAIEKGCSNLMILAFPHCRMTDVGFNNLISILNKDSLLHIQHLDLSNNLLSQEAALSLSRIIYSRKLKHLSLRLNPIGSDGAAALFCIISKMNSLQYLDISACSITDSIGRILLKFILEIKYLEYMDISNNDLGEELGKNIYKIIGFNKTLKYFDVRNTGITNEYKNKIYGVLFQNRTTIKCSPQMAKMCSTKR